MTDLTPYLHLKCPTCDYPFSAPRCPECGSILLETHDPELLRHSDPKVVKALSRWSKVLAVSFVISIIGFVVSFLLGLLFAGMNAAHVILEYMLIVVLIGTLLSPFVPVVSMWIFSTKVPAGMKHADSACRMSILGIAITSAVGFYTMIEYRDHDIVVVMRTILFFWVAAFVWSSAVLCESVWLSSAPARYFRGYRRKSPEMHTTLYKLLAILWIAGAVLTPFLPEDPFQRGFTRSYPIMIVQLIRLFGMMGALYFLGAASAHLFAFARSLKAENDAHVSQIPVDVQSQTPMMSQATPPSSLTPQ